MNRVKDLSITDHEEAVGFGGNQDGADPPSVEERITALEEKVDDLMLMMRQVLDNAVPKPEVTK